MTQQSSNLPNVLEVQDLAMLQSQMLRPVQNLNLDGAFELGYGTTFLCYGLGSYFNAALQKFFPISPWVGWLGYLPLLAAAFAPFVIPRIIRRSITWPRTGYVADPNEVKLVYLIQLMVFGAALGISLTMPFILFSQVIDAIHQQAAHREWRSIQFHAIELALCLTLVTYLGRKVIRKRHPLPTAYDAELITQAFRQTPRGRMHLRMVKLTILLMFAGIPILLAGVVVGLIYLSGSAMWHSQFDWTQWGIVCFLVATNGCLYLMTNGAATKHYPWKWLMLVLMLAGPILMAPVLPVPRTLELFSFFKTLPPVMLSIGLLWLVSGAATLIIFILRNPLPGEETQ